MSFYNSAGLIYCNTNILVISYSQQHGIIQVYDVKPFET